MSSETLAIITPTVGLASETFICRHVNELYPEGTVLVTAGIRGNFWKHDCPALMLDEIPRWSPHRVIPAVVRRIGYDLPSGRPKVRRFLRAHNVTVVLAEFLTFAFPWMRLVQSLGIRFFAHAHGWDASAALRNRKWQMRYPHYNLAEGIIAPSHFSAARLAESGLDPRKLHVLPCGVEVPEEPTRHIENLEKIRCLAVSRMVPKKAPLTLLESFYRASLELKNLHLDFIGDGPLLAAAREFVSNHHLSDRVTLYGPQHNDVVLRLLRESDIFIQHSVTAPDGDEEGLGIAILEAMAYALPVVATRHDGIPETVVHNHTGFLVDEQDAIGMAHYLIRLAGDFGTRQKMGEAGWRRMTDKFSWKIIQSRLKQILGLS